MNWNDIIVAQERRKDMLREAESDRFSNELRALDGRSLWRRSADWLTRTFATGRRGVGAQRAAGFQPDQLRVIARNVREGEGRATAETQPGYGQSSQN
jgi:hypothetical protein